MGRKNDCDYCAHPMDCYYDPACREHFYGDREYRRYCRDRQLNPVEEVMVAPMDCMKEFAEFVKTTFNSIFSFCSFPRYMADITPPRTRRRYDVGLPSSFQEAQLCSKHAPAVVRNVQPLEVTPEGRIRCYNMNPEKPLMEYSHAKQPRRRRSSQTTETKQSTSSQKTPRNSSDSERYHANTWYPGLAEKYHLAKLEREKLADPLHPDRLRNEKLVVCTGVQTSPMFLAEAD